MLLIRRPFGVSSLPYFIPVLSPQRQLFIVARFLHDFVPVLSPQRQLFYVAALNDIREKYMFYFECKHSQCFALRILRKLRKKFESLERRVPIEAIGETQSVFTHDVADIYTD